MKYIKIFSIFIILAIGVAIVVVLNTSLNKQSRDTNIKSPNQIKNMENTNLKLKSCFENGESIPMKYSCDGKGINPPLEIDNVPEDTKSLVLIMDDPDVPGGGVFDHWVVFNIPPNTKNVEEGEEPRGVLGKNSSGKLGYFPACPPDKEHRYIFRLYALNTSLELEAGSTKEEVETAMEGSIIEGVKLLGRYDRQ